MCKTGKGGEHNGIKSIHKIVMMVTDLEFLLGKDEKDDMRAWETVTRDAQRTVRLTNSELNWATILDFFDPERHFQNI